MPTHDFNKSSQLGLKGIDIVSRYLHSLPETKKVIDVQDDPFFQREDVDLLWFRHGQPKTKIEVKTDSHNTGNLFFETTSNAENGTPGCFIYSAAHILCYVFLASSLFIAMSFPRLRAWFSEHIQDFKEVKTRTRTAGKGYTSFGRLVPVSWLLNATVAVPIPYKG